MNSPATTDKMIAAAFTSGQRVTDADGNRATFLRMGDKRNGFNWLDNIAIVRYVGERHESACPAHDLTSGWGNA